MFLQKKLIRLLQVQIVIKEYIQFIHYKQMYMEQKKCMTQERRN